MSTRAALDTTDGGAQPDGGPSGDGGPDGGQLAYILTVTDYNDGCSILGLGDAGPLPTAAFVAGTVAQLAASPNPGYVWGYWTGTDGADGGQDTKMDATVTMDGNRTVFACCPLPPPSVAICPTPMP